MCLSRGRHKRGGVPMSLLVSFKIHPTRVPLSDYPKIDLNPGVLLLGGMNHPWV